MLVLKKNNDPHPRALDYLDSLVRPGRRPPKQKYAPNTKPSSVPYGDHSLDGAEVRTRARHATHTVVRSESLGYVYMDYGEKVPA